MDRDQIEKNTEKRIQIVYLVSTLETDRNTDIHIRCLSEYRFGFSYIHFHPYIQGQAGSAGQGACKCSRLAYALAWDGRGGGDVAACARN